MATAGIIFAVSIPAPSAAAPAAPASRSFFDPFDRIDTRRWYVSDGWTNGGHQGCTWSRENMQIVRGVLQLRHTIAPNRFRRYKCAEIRTLARLGYGTYEARIRTAAGAGLNTAMFTYSGPPQTPVHDEIDFEFLGKQPNAVQLNYYTAARGGHETSADLGGNASAAFNNYAMVWSPQSIKWYLNGRLIRTVQSPGLPSTPGQFFLSLWSGSDSVNAWLGKFSETSQVVTAEIDWIAYTAPDQSCLFRESMTCNRP
jgi:endo-1,3-1,4-beta-glycanase ExoK